MQALIAEFNNTTKAGIETIAGALQAFASQAAEKMQAAMRNPIAAAADDEQYQLDAALWESAPTVAVPKFAAFQALQEVGHRFLATAEGLYLEVRRPWLHLIQPVAPLQANAPRPPYGAVPKKVELAFERLGTAFPFIRQFADAARQALPNEHAAWIVWDSQAKQLAYRDVTVANSTPGAIRFERPQLAEHESLAIDMHSHGATAAFFSSTDDQDDAGEVKISCVLGDLVDGQPPSIQFRICVLGMMLPITVPASAIFGDGK